MKNSPLSANSWPCTTSADGRFRLPSRVPSHHTNLTGKRNLPSAEVVHGQELADNGLFFIGDKGMMYCPDSYGDTYKLLPAKDFEGYKEPEPTLPRLGKGDYDLLHKQEWIAACKANKPELALSNFDYSGLLTEAVLLGNVARSEERRVGKEC